MKEFEFDDIEISDEVEEGIPELDKQPEALEEDPLYQKFSFDIDTDGTEQEPKEEIIEEVKIEPEVKEDIDKKNINDLFEDKEQEYVPEDKPLFSNSNKEIDNPFVKVEVKEEPVVEKRNIYEEANENIKPIISFDEKEIENKEDALEEALSHTTKFTPFKDDKPVINELEVEEEKEEGKEKNGVVYLIILFIILLIAIFIIPKIASLL